MFFRKKKNHQILFLWFIFSCFLYSNQNIIKVINYNIYGLPPILTKDKNSDRIKFIFENTSKKYDLILFQENWIYQNLLEDYFYNHAIVIGNKTKFIKKNNPKRSSGLNIIANQNIIIQKYNEYLFDVCNGWLSNGNDCFASKGFIYSKLEVSGSAFNLFLTHLDAGYSKNDIKARKQQIQNLEEEINKIDINEPIVICGDFNINYYTNGDIIDNFMIRNNLQILRWDKKTDVSKMIDFVLLRDGKNIKINLLDYGVDDSLLLYSDHPPIYFEFILNGDKKNKL